MTNLKTTLARISSIAALTAAAFCAQAEADCPDQWQPYFGVSPGTDGTASTVRAVTLWDPDGSGPLPPQPVIGGDFQIAGGVNVYQIAHWDGQMWLPFGTGPSGGLFATVRALTTWDPDGPGPLPAVLVAGGDFVGNASGTYNHVVIWDGTTWQTLAGGFAGSNVTVSSLTTWDPDGPGPMNP
ncbi:MAG TPA: hypothetical protein VMV81_12770, partial [Phycisphaerae bacterium]|nr:hypothetical protein [Phycisphaerae bacterium]